MTKQDIISIKENYFNLLYQIRQFVSYVEHLGENEFVADVIIKEDTILVRINDYEYAQYTNYIREQTYTMDRFIYWFNYERVG